MTPVRRTAAFLAPTLVLALIAAFAAVQAMNLPGWLVPLAAGATAPVSLWLERWYDAWREGRRKESERIERLTADRQLILDAMPGGDGLVRDLAADELLGVHRAIPLDEGADGGLSRVFPTYVPRRVDARLRAYLEAARDHGGFALLVGDSATGKTRAALEAVKAVLPGWRMVRPVDGEMLRTMRRQRIDLSRSVLWLDEIQRFLVDRPLKAADVEAVLADRRHPVIIIGTIWPANFDLLSAPAIDGQPDLNENSRAVLAKVVERFDVTTEFTAEELQEVERAAARDSRLAVAASLSAGIGITRTLAAVPELIHRWRHGGDTFGRAVITAAVQSRRCGHPEPVPPHVLEAVAETSLTPAQRASADSEWFPKAVAWACRPVRGAVSPLVPVGRAVGQMDGYLVSDAVVQEAARDPGAPGAQLTDAVWEAVIKATNQGDAAYAIAWSASHADRDRHMRDAFLRAADLGHGGAMNQLGVFAEDRGEARAWFRRGAEAGDSLAVSNLVELVKDSDPAEAEHWLRRSADNGDDVSMLRLGDLAMTAGRTEEAEQWYRKAADLGHPHAMLLLGKHLLASDRRSEADLILRRAAELGPGAPMYWLWAMWRDSNPAQALEWARRCEGGEHEGADVEYALEVVQSDPALQLAWWRQVAEFGKPYAMLNLASWLRDSDPAEAEQWLRRAVDLDSPDAMNRLGEQLVPTDAGEAEQLFRRAVESHQDTAAMVNLGVLLSALERGQEAEEWLRAAADKDDASAMRSLGAFLVERDRLDEGEQWLRKATERGDAQAMLVLGVLLAQTDRFEEAGRWWRTSADRGNPDGMWLYAQFLESTGDAEQARHWLRRSAEDGSGEAALSLGVQLYNAGQADEAEPFYRQAAEDGLDQAMFNLALLLDATDRADEARGWLRDAADYGNVEAMVRMGNHLADEDADQAERYFRPAAEWGHLEAMLCLALLLTTAGRTDEAIEWSDRVVAACRDLEADEPGRRLVLAYALYLSALARNIGDVELSQALDAALESVALHEELRDEGGDAADENAEQLDGARQVAADLLDKLGRPEEASQLRGVGK
jgi:TPR repeat protein